MKVERVIPLHKHPLFLAALWVPLFLSLVVGGAIAFEERLHGFCLAAACWDRFYELFKFPILLASLFVPLTAVVAAIHRSQETQVQLATARDQFAEVLRQNTFNGYIKHKEEFGSLVLRLEQKHNVKLTDVAHLYNVLFYSNNYKYFDVTYSYPEGGVFYLEELSGTLSDVIALGNVATTEYPVPEEDTVRFVDRLGHVTGLLGMKFEADNETKIVFKDYALHIFHWPEGNLWNDIDIYIDFVRTLASFCFYEISHPIERPVAWNLQLMASVDDFVKDFGVPLG
jgi:hypothetical protein